MRRSARTYAQLSGKSSERVGGGATIGRSVRCNPNRLTFPDVATGIPLSASICFRNPTSRDTFLGPAGNAIVSLDVGLRSEEHTSELQSLAYLVCRLLLEKKKKRTKTYYSFQRHARTRLNWY